MPNRRRFLATAGAAAAATVLPTSSEGGRRQAGASERADRPLLKPRRLSRGDRVGLVAPASATFFPVELDIAQETLTAMGLKVSVGEHVLARRGYLAGSDEERAADLNGFFADPAVAGIFALRGGWGSARLLPLLEYETIRRHPKVLVGYSDITALLTGIHAKTGLVSFHGPVGMSRWNQFNYDWLRRVVFAGQAVTFQNISAVERGELAQRAHRIRTIAPGTARGRLLGGNLTVLTAILGSDYVPDFGGAILFLEDTDEAPYRIDRMMTQLKLAGILDRVAGVVFGECTDCHPGEGSYGSLTLEEILVHHVEPLGIPAWHGAMIGHLPRQFTLPEGIPVEIDATAGTIRMLEAAVI